MLRTALTGRRFTFDIERAVFLTVLHRIFHSESGSDFDACSWQRDHRIEGVSEIPLHHLYRAMAWLGETLPGQPPDAKTPRCVKDRLEERLFARRRTLFSQHALVFFDTSSVFFTGEGGATLGAHGKSKDRRPDCKQLVLGMVLDRDGWPVCSEVWAGDTADVTTLARVAQRLRERLQHAPGVRGGGRRDDQPQGDPQTGGDGLGIHPGHQFAADGGGQEPGSGRQQAVPGGRVGVGEAEAGGRAETRGQGGGVGAFHWWRRSALRHRGCSGHG